MLTGTICTLLLWSLSTAVFPHLCGIGPKCVLTYLVIGFQRCSEYPSGSIERYRAHCVTPVCCWLWCHPSIGGFIDTCTLLIYFELDSRTKLNYTNNTLKWGSPQLGTINAPWSQSVTAGPPTRLCMLRSGQLGQDMIQFSFLVFNLNFLCNLASSKLKPPNHESYLGGWFFSLLPFLFVFSAV